MLFIPEVPVHAGLRALARKEWGATVTNALLLVDYENVQQLDFALLGDGSHVMIFVGATQKNVPIELVSSAQQLGTRIELAARRGQR